MTGMLSPTGWLRMSVAVAGGPYLYLCRKGTDENLPNILKRCASYLEDDTFITQGGRINIIITVFYYEQNMTPEKNGRNFSGELAPA